MPFCPKCKYEYRQGIEKCPDCNARLVERLPEEKPVEEPENIEWVKLGTLTDEPQINIIKSVLESAGIPVWVRVDVVPWVEPYTAGPLSERSISVPASRVKEAEEVLRNARMK